MVIVLCIIHAYGAIEYLKVQCNATAIFDIQSHQPVEPLDILTCDTSVSILLGIMVIFGFWVFLLLTTQLWMNLIEGSTTNESINFKRYAAQRGHGHAHGRRQGPELTEEERMKKIKQFAPLKMSMLRGFRLRYLPFDYYFSFQNNFFFLSISSPISARFLDLFRLRRRNIDWTKCYTTDDLIKGGLMKRVDDPDIV